MNHDHQPEAGVGHFLRQFRQPFKKGRKCRQYLIEPLVRGAGEEQGIGIARNAVWPQVIIDGVMNDMKRRRPGGL